MKDLGVLKYFLGIEVAHSNAGIFLSQRKYALDILIETVHTLAQFFSNPQVAHWDAAIRVLRYIKVIRRHVPSLVDHYPGIFILLGQCPVSWKTKKQPTIARSSAEAEYRVMAVTTCELKWLKFLLRSFGVLHPQPIWLFCDSQFALHIVKNPIFHERTKHIEVDCHFIRNELQDHNISPTYVPTSHQLADILTKALGRQQFIFLLCKLDICDLHAPN
ncbi:hypothetical protein LIER_37474 [Lithospermum erythrorhizon]|uniref:Retrovirus-related Pol polyprotein from transposon RE2 n=1 Tax=Lithospermum erythrorhizon TaxID=34254 RepID=A0AAV3PMC6_LITER